MADDDVGARPHLEARPRVTPGLRAVADRAGASRSLTSLALRGDDGVSPARRAEIVRAADALGVAVGALARRRAEGGPLVLGVVVDDDEAPRPDELLAGARSAAEALGFVVRRVGGEPGAGLPSALEAVHRQAGGPGSPLGLLVVGGAPSRRSLASARADHPVVLVGAGGAEHAPPGVDTVRADEEEGMRCLMLHLASVGHVRTCFVGASDDARTARRARAHAATAEWLCSAADVRADAADLPDDPARLARHVGEGVTAFVAADDRIAARLVAAVSALGLPLPGSVAVTGFGDDPVAGGLGLTTVAAPAERLGARAVELLVERLRGRRADHHVVLPTDLVRRASTDGGAGA